MAGVDTNVVVRFLTADDPRQTDQATRQIEQGVWVSLSVLIEIEWVLRASFGWDRSRINEAFRSFVALHSVEVELTGAVAWALDRHRQGADWADMLHLVAARHQTAFVTFDQSLVREAGTSAPVLIEVLR